MVQISVVIPAYNAEKTISATFRALERQSYPKEAFEVVVIDDGSTDGTSAVIARQAREGALRIKVLSRDRLHNSGAASARNDGMAVAVGRIIAFTDADCIPDADWLFAIDAALLGRGLMLVSGETWCDDVLLFPWRMSPANQRPITANLAYDRQKTGALRFSSVFRWVIGEDTDFVWRAEAQGAMLSHIPDIRVCHPSRTMGMLQVARSAYIRQNEIFLFKRYGTRALQSIHPFFRPAVFGRISFAAIGSAVIPALFILLWASFGPLAPPVVAALLVGVFFVNLYEHCVIYRPPARARYVVPLVERAKTLFYLLEYVPILLLARLVGSWRFRYFML